MSFDWRATLVVPEDVAITPQGEEFVVHRPGSRGKARALDADGARLLQAFREPRRIVDVVVAMARATEVPAGALLDQCFPLLRAIVDAGMLTVAGGGEDERLAPLLEEGARLGRWQVEACVRLVDDSEVYRARCGDVVAAIKRLRPRGVALGLALLLRRELEVLRRLDATLTPALLDAQLDDDLPWFAVTWFEGVRANLLAADCDRVAVAVAIADSYAALHSAGVLHGDVHPGNIMVGPDGRVRLLDFALARVPDDRDLDRVVRGAATGFWEPEFAAAMARGAPEPSVTPAGEQYAVANLIDGLLAGSPGQLVAEEGAEKWTTVLFGDRRCFVERGRRAWPTVERVLRRGMALDPTQRYPDTTALARDLRAAVACPDAAVQPSEDPVAAFLSEVTPGGALFESGLMVEPRASFNFGAAGIAFALYRVARARDDGELLAFAEVWQRRAEEAIEAGGGLYDSVEFRPDALGRISPYHTAAGVWLTRAILARAAGDLRQLDAAVDRYVALVGASAADELDLALGCSGALLGTALLFGLRPTPPLRQLGDCLIASIWSQIGVEPLVASCRGVGYLGMAHGWAGHLYAALAWARATLTPPPDTVVRRYGELSTIGDAPDPMGRVPVVVPGQELGDGIPRYMDGWCHGQAGHVLLRVLAANVLDEPGELDAAALLGEATFLGREDLGNLCCGLAGRAYAMLALHRATRDPKWLDRARLLATRARRGTACDRWPNSLYKGRVGLAVLMAELDRPDLAAMPLFEDEGFL